ncbi:alpha-1,2-fucosyltransferase [Yersinia pekkanenii]|uniref:Glycosyl transferase n=2 Tax=Yersinia TaxID=629 RepID=A0A0T9NL01_9GAMM|nr:alpha-1,2-fucosyltransferase [Yersinia pekkanenii]CNH16685.1 putative glycosyl transferase [Yersinia pekkanenii]CRY65665.1 putative glycosyl transferase [Yersinia pekkanenii]
MKISVLVQGGLGNQLFQIAWANYLVRKYQYNVEINLQLLYSQSQHASINFSQLIGKVPLLSVSKEKLIMLDDRLSSKIIRKSLRILGVHSIPNILLHDYDALTDFEHCNKMANYRYQFGYFQFIEAAIFSRDIFLSNMRSIHGEFIKKCESEFFERHYVGIHIRRGDFIKSTDPLHLATGIDYIKKSIKKFNNRNFIVFSDDIGWCRDKLGESDGIVYFSGNSAIEDFIGLMCCKDFILSGSTFSWWAAILSLNENTRVVIPNSKAQFMSIEANTRIGWDFEVV